MATPSSAGNLYALLTTYVPKDAPFVVPAARTSPLETKEAQKKHADKTTSSSSKRTKVSATDEKIDAVKLKYLRDLTAVLALCKQRINLEDDIIHIEDGIKGLIQNYKGKTIKQILGIPSEKIVIEHPNGQSETLFKKSVTVIIGSETLRLYIPYSCKDCPGNNCKKCKFNSGPTSFMARANLIGIDTKSGIKESWVVTKTFLRIEDNHVFEHEVNILKKLKGFASVAHLEDYYKGNIYFKFRNIGPLSLFLEKSKATYSDPKDKLHFLTMMRGFINGIYELQTKGVQHTHLTHDTIHVDISKSKSSFNTTVLMNFEKAIASTTNETSEIYEHSAPEHLEEELTKLQGGLVRREFDVGLKRDMWAIGCIMLELIHRRPVGWSSLIKLFQNLLALDAALKVEDSPSSPRFEDNLISLKIEKMALTNIESLICPIWPEAFNMQCHPEMAEYRNTVEKINNEIKKTLDDVNSCKPSDLIPSEVEGLQVMIIKAAKVIKNKLDEVLRVLYATKYVDPVEDFIWHQILNPDVRSRKLAGQLVAEFNTVVHPYFLDSQGKLITSPAPLAREIKQPETLPFSEAPPKRLSQWALSGSFATFFNNPALLVEAGLISKADLDDNKAIFLRNIHQRLKPEKARVLNNDSYLSSGVTSQASLLPKPAVSSEPRLAQSLPQPPLLTSAPSPSAVAPQAHGPSQVRRSLSFDNLPISTAILGEVLDEQRQKE